MSRFHHASRCLVYLLGAFGVALAPLMLTSPARAQSVCTDPVGFTTLSVRAGGGSGTINPDGGYGVAVDALRNVIVVGVFDGTANFGGADLTGTNDIFIAKYGPSGAHLWSKRFGSNGADIAYSVATDPLGNIYVAGNFTGTVDFGNGIGLISGGGLDAFIAKYAPNGTTLWSRRMGGVGNETAFSLAYHVLGVVITGFYTAACDFGGAALTSFGSNDIVVARFDEFSGGHMWSKGLGSAGPDIGNSVAVDAAGNVIVTGYFTNTVNFGGANLVSAGSSDIFLAKYDVAGVHQWSQRFGSTSSDQANGVCVEGASNIVMAGSFMLTVSFGGSNLVSNGGSNDIFLARYNSAGTHQWSQRFGDSTAESAFGVTAGAGIIAMTGYFGGSINFGGGFMNTAGLSDGFITVFTPPGANKGSELIRGESNDDGRAVAIDVAGNIVNTGRFQGAATVAGEGVFSNGGYDMYVTKQDASCAHPNIMSVVDIGNDQGRRVKITFTGSGGDNADAATPINSYEAYRRDDAPPAAIVAGPQGLSRRELLDSGWTFAGAVPAHQQSSYGIDAPTIGDSTITSGLYNSTFFIRAASDQVNVFYDSDPDSGYSLDNLAPWIPENFVYTAGDLSWTESTAEDFDYFTVYGSNTDAFGAATLVDYSVAPELDVTSSPYTFYYVTATDFSGNEGKPAKVNTLSGAGGTPKSYVLSVSNYPNPFNPRTTVSYTVPSRGTVSISIYDVHGALVATLFSGDRSAGAYTIEWDGRDQSGTPVSTGVYLARIEHSSGTRSKKMVLLK